MGWYRPSISFSEYTSVDKREEPLDFLDALLFWINKICLLVRDDVERHDVPLKGTDDCDAIIPEMEDLYEDLCDGTCICALVRAFLFLLYHCLGRFL